MIEFFKEINKTLSQIILIFIVLQLIGLIDWPWYQIWFPMFVDVAIVIVFSLLDFIKRKYKNEN